LLFNLNEQFNLLYDIVYVKITPGAAKSVKFGVLFP
jgi:hypothetical protein